MIAAAQAGDEMGRQSAGILLARVETPQRPVQQQFLKAELRVHEPREQSGETMPREGRVQESLGESV
jgi:hypothetical protein